MEPIKISVTGALATVTQKPVLTSGTVGLGVEFTFDESWAGLSKTAVFRCGSKAIPPVLCKDDRAEVPWEALEKPGCTLFVGVYGTNSEGINLPTVWAEVDRVREGATVPDVDPSKPTPTIYEQILQVAESAVETANSVREDADSGKFNGYTPVRGTDYWTEADKAEMKAYIDASIGAFDPAFDAIIELQNSLIDSAVLDDIIETQNDLIGGDDV